MSSFPTIPGYTLIERLYESSRTTVYRAIEIATARSVIVKLPQQKRPDINDLLQFRNQYAVAKNLELPGIVRPYHLLPYSTSYALILEDFNGISLHHYARERTLCLLEVLKIARQLAQILHRLHQEQIIHKDIKPANILIQPKTQQIKLIDFGIASRLPPETTEIQNPNVLEGTLAYIAPEQTGRMNRGLDYRADFYSMGVTLFELLTGKLPFEADEPLKLVHCHLAKIPPPVNLISPEIPLAVAEIANKLMAKNAEDRYQTALGIQKDLEFCIDQCEATGNIDFFTIGQQDVCERFSIPEKLYGREKEVAQLLEAFDRVSSGSTEMMLVTGISGIGKTSVINELHKPIVRQQGYFIKGKYDQFQRNIPFSAIVQALRQLVEQLLSESEAQKATWKHKILAALGDSGQVLTSLIPELENSIGKQPIAPELSGQASQNRFNLLFQNFFKLFCQKEHPLVIFLDDLQWADSASLELLHILVKNTEYLLILGAYRDNEVTPLHPLTLTLEEIAKAGAVINTIKLQALEKADLYELVSDTLHCRDDFAIVLTQSIAQKTQGNLFFVTRFLKALHNEKLIVYDRVKKCWQGKIEKVTAFAMTEDVVEFMVLQLQKLTVEVQKILTFAACLGAEFDLRTLAIVSHCSSSDAIAALWQAWQENFVMPIGKASQLLAFSESHEDIESSVNPTYRFLHDRIQQALYSLIPEERKKSTHYQIGQLLLQKIPLESREEHIFEIVNHLDRGLELIEEPTETDKLVQLNLEAARKAKAATAYQLAADYYRIARSLIASKTWETDYERHLEIYTESVESAFLIADFEEVNRLAEQVLQNTRTFIDSARIHEIKAQAFIAQNQLDETIQLGLNFLEQLGLVLPNPVSRSEIEAAFEENDKLLQTTAIEDIANLGLIPDPEKEAIVRMITLSGLAMYIANPSLLMLAVAKQVNLCIRYGNTSTSADAFATYGLFLCGEFGDIQQGYRFGSLAIAVLDKLQALEIKSLVYVLVNGFVKHWRDPYRSTLIDLKKGYEYGLETGDFQNAALSGYCYCVHLFICGESLLEIRKEIQRYLQAAEAIQQMGIVGWLFPFLLSTQRLLEPSETPGLLCESEAVEWKKIEEYERASDRTGLFLFAFHKSYLAYLLGERNAALQQARIARAYLDGVTGQAVVPAFYFYEALILLAQPEIESFQEQLQANREALKNWAKHAPENIQHRWDLVEAEEQARDRNWAAALESYDRAIAGAKESGFIPEEALANELAAKFYLDWDLDSARPNGKEKVAAVYMQEAYFCYARWGAQAKIADLEKRYPQLLSESLQPTASLEVQLMQQNAQKGSTLGTTTGNAQLLDLSTIARASQSISGEIVFDKLLAQLIALLIENAGAQRGVLILAEGDRWQIEAMGEMNEVLEAKALPSVPLDESHDLPLSVIHYVQRSKTEVVIADACCEENYLKDPYIIQAQPKSILAAPILNQGKIIGIIYLENNLITNAFTPTRLEVTNILASQAAISLENARLYRTLEQKVEDRTAQLAAANEEILSLNQRLQKENLRMSSELNVIKQLQQMVLPRTEELQAVSDLDIAGYMEPADEVGGDYYDVLQDKGDVKIAIGDVTGHGLESGVLMMMAQTAVRTLKESGERDPVRFFDILNRTLYGNIERLKAERSMTLAMLDYRDGEFRLSGQHEEAIIARANGEMEIIDTLPLGFPLGLEEEIGDFVAAENFVLQPGDALVLYSDGITEAEDSEGKHYGQQRLSALVREHRALAAEGIRDAIVADVRQHIGHGKVWDDIMLVAIKRRE